MAPSRARLAPALATALVSAAVAGGLGWWVVARLRTRPAYAFVDQAQEVEALFAARGETASSITAAGPLALEPMDEETAQKLFTIYPGVCAYDPLCYYRYVPGVESTTQWPEHPDGRWTRRTNSAGLREDGEATLADADLGVLVTGDSHADGACNNAESFANRLEVLLRERHPDERVEVLNAGVTGYSFYNYLGVLRRSLAEGATPDAFVVAVYGGNDFKGVLKSHHWFRGTTYPPQRRTYYARIDAAAQVSKKLLAQALSQVLFFQEYPDQVDVALEGALVTVREIGRLCSARGVRLVFVYIPAAWEVPWPGLARMTERAQEALGLSRADLAVADDLRRRWFEGVGALGVDLIDMTPIYRAQPKRCYWDQDLHINLLGHQLIAAVLDEHLAAGGGALGPPSDGALAVGRAGGAPLDAAPDGPWEQRDAEGRLRATGAFADGRRDGEWRWLYEDGSPQKAGSYRAGEPVGAWREWYRGGGLRRETEWADGAPHGRTREWREDGGLACEGRYEGGLESGPWRTFLPDGQLQTLQTYRGGVLHGPCERRDEQGRLSWRGTHEDGLRHGTWETWHTNGQRSSQGEYVRGLQVGEWRYWDEEGRLDEEKSGRRPQRRGSGD